MTMSFKKMAGGVAFYSGEGKEVSRQPSKKSPYHFSTAGQTSLPSAC